jgi:hypothetical protein
MRFAVPLPEVTFVHEVAMAHDQQASVLAGLFFKFEGLIQSCKIYTCNTAGFFRIFQGAPPAIPTGRREVLFTSGQTRLRQQRKDEQPQKHSRCLGHGDVVLYRASAGLTYRVAPPLVAGARLGG